MAAQPPDSENRWLKSRTTINGSDYDAPYKARAQAGENVHGEADFVESFHPKSVLDAGCGTGRVAIELARRGIDVVGVDLDRRLLGTAQEKAPHLDWHLDDIATVDLGRQFDVIVMAGNVMIFLTPGTEVQVLRNMARHLAPGGRLITAFQLSMGYLELDDYDRYAHEAGLGLVRRYSTWDGNPWYSSSTYALSLHEIDDQPRTTE